MIRVGFYLNLSTSWLGGLHYYRNLLNAIHDNLSSELIPVLFRGIHTENELLNGFPPVETISDSCFDRYGFRWFLQRMGDKYLNRNFILNKILADNSIDVISQSGLLGLNCNQPVLSWIPDFQHINLQEMFSHSELKKRNNNYKEVFKRSNIVVLSSYNAQKNLADFAPEYLSKSRVLQFVVKPYNDNFIIGKKKLQKKYNIDGQFFHLPNQFWVHKNHNIVVDALKSLKADGKKVQIVATGNTMDYRNSSYFNQFKEKIEHAGLSDSFRILGIVPYIDMVSLMYHSIGVINPSLFEGWSTTVEEAKSYGKYLVLSDIEVHREQALSSVIFFNPHDEEALAKILWNSWSLYDFENELKLKQNAKSEFPVRWRGFADKYLKIVKESMRSI